MNEVFQVERNAFLVKDDKHVFVQIFARFGKISGLVWLCHVHAKLVKFLKSSSTKLALIFSESSTSLYD